MMGLHALIPTVLTVVGTLIFWFSWRLYCHRSWINKLRESGMPMPSWSWLFGHIVLLYRHHRLLPSLSNVNLAFLAMFSEFVEDEMFLLDIWPMGQPMLVLFNPEAASRICQKLNLPKAQHNEDMFRPLTGGPALVSMNGIVWKRWRSYFNPGFSTGAIADQLPQIVDSVSSFCQRLEEQAIEGKITHLDDFTIRLTFEVIMKITLNADVGTNYDKHILVRAMENILNWHSFWDPLVLLNPLRPIVQWYNGRVVNTWIQEQLEERYKLLKRDFESPSAEVEKRPKSIMDLAIEAFIADKAILPERLDSHFLKIACQQVRLFLFVGNDTTSSTIVFACHLLSKHPAYLAKLREEHDQIFGINPAHAAAELKKDPTLLHKCKYTLAIIKETLRLYPPAATMRIGEPDTFLQTHRGVSIPTQDLALLVPHHCMHRNSRLWPRTEEFLPDRWLVGPGHELYPQPGAWRAFEIGPRDCIGQTLSLSETKVVLIMIARTFNIGPAYEEFDAMEEDRGWLGWFRCHGGLGSEVAKTWKGDRAYQTEKAGAHPSDGYPCRIYL